MTTKLLFAALVTVAATAPAAAQAPQGSEMSLYCLRVEPETGSRIESVQCWTRAEWADAEVDVDADWAENGVRVIG
jgi:hypothetical protein